MFGVDLSIEALRERQYENKQFDGIKEAVEQLQSDPIGERAAITAISSMRMSALLVVLQTTLFVTEGQGVDQSEELLPSELLDSLMLEAISEDDEDDDAKVSAIVKSVLSAHVADAFSSLGVSDDVLTDVYASDPDIADTAIESACQTVLENLPDDGDPLDEFAEAFAFGYDLDADYENEEDVEETFDGVGRNKKNLIAGKSTVKKIGGRNITYKAVKAMRHGKMVVINKRIKGTIKLSSKQKGALRKARRSAHRGAAMMMRGKSILKGVSNGSVYNHLSDKALAFLSGAAKGAQAKGSRKYLHGLKSNSPRVNNPA